MSDLMFAESNDVIGSMNAGNPTESGLCALCRTDCQGKCETWLGCLVGRKLLYPRDFGVVAASANNASHVGVSYDNLRIQGYAYGVRGRKEDLGNNSDDCIFPDVRLETEFGWTEKTKVRMPLMTCALGSTFVAQKYWNGFFVGSALCGMPIVIGENVVGIDQKSRIKSGGIRKGKITSAPELERRIDRYFRYYDGYGAIVVQLNVEDTQNGVAEFVVDKYGDKCIIELKWGQGAMDIGSEIQITNLEYAQFLKERGYMVDPDPTRPEVQDAFKNGVITTFARHSRLGNTSQSTAEQVRQEFMTSVEYLRGLGFKRITMKIGSYGMKELAMAIKFATDAKLDLLTIDGSGGGTGMSPWNMMQSWGVPSINLHSKAYEYATILGANRQKVVDMSFAGGFSREDHIFKALALGAPYTKMVCLGRALMVPGFLGANIEGALHPEKRKQLYGQWNELPKTVQTLGSTAQEIFAGYSDVQKKVGADEIKKIPYGAIAVYTLMDKLACGLQQLMAGARKFSVSEICRNDLFSGNRETAQETGIPHVTEINDEYAKQILNS